MMNGAAVGTGAVSPPPQDSLHLHLTSTTAPGKVFRSRDELASHYKSDWHKYNLKRREAGLPVLLESDFVARLEAATALQLEREKEAEAKRQNHLRSKNKNKGAKSDRKESRRKQLGHPPQQQTRGEDLSAASEAVTAEVEETAPRPQAKPNRSTEPPLPLPAEETAAVGNDGNIVGDKSDPNKAELEPEEEKEMEIEIDPRRCLFDSHVSPTVEANVDRMRAKYGFFVPDREYLVDLEGLVGYCHEAIQLGHCCLWCQKVFSTPRACQKHMVDKGHAKLLYQPGRDLEDFSVFYDFASVNDEFLIGLKGGAKCDANDDVPIRVGCKDDNDNMDGEDGWEDVSSDDEDPGGAANDDADDDDEEDEDILHLYRQEVEQMGLDVTALGELVFPDGRIVGHRSLRRYYKQRLMRHQPASEAVIAARLGASERLHRGRVYRLTSSYPISGHHGGGKALRIGRAGGGVLVPLGGGGTLQGGEFRQLSVYRFRAAVRKERYGELYGRRLRERTNLNVNRMDKKANRLMNGVSVAHAAR